MVLLGSEEIREAVRLGGGELAGDLDLSMCRSRTSFSLSSPDEIIESASETGL